MPEPAPRRPQRRVNPDKAPLNRLPLIKADSRSGPISVIRGEFDVTELTDTQCDHVHFMHPDELVVFTNSLGQHTLARRNQLIDRDIDLSKAGTLPGPVDLGGWFIPVPPDIESGVAWLRYNAERLLELAETWEDLAAAGWEVHDDPRLAPYGDIVQRGPERDPKLGSDAEDNAEPSPDDAP